MPRPTNCSITLSPPLPLLFQKATKVTLKPTQSLSPYNLLQVEKPDWWPELDTSVEKYFEGGLASSTLKTLTLITQCTGWKLTLTTHSQASDSIVSVIKTILYKWWK